jgi:hypothetical protein
MSLINEYRATEEAIKELQARLKNGEVIETKGGNHKTLKEWKAKWGGDVVEGWATLLG